MAEIVLHTWPGFAVPGRPPCPTSTPFGLKVRSILGWKGLPFRWRIDLAVFAHFERVLCGADPWYEERLGERPALMAWIGAVHGRTAGAPGSGGTP